MEELPPKLYVYSFKQDDPQKCTSAKLLHYGYVKNLVRKKAIPRKSIVLNPFVKEVLTVSDRKVAEKFGIIVLDCSWASAQEIFSKQWKGVHRRLPLIIPGNPVSYGKIGRLTALEAFSATLIIFSYKKTAMKLLSLYKWGSTFLQLNKEILEAYSKCLEEQEIRQIEQEIMEHRF